MEPFYYNKMNKLQQAVYHGMLQGINALESEIQIPRIDGRQKICQSGRRKNTSTILSVKMSLTIN
ncbi:hypothetical protein [Eubacterium ramulus]|uniref:hypothetical protein n=1 Tax=Eubacterium ramulus TaxID=39490 RepID=UPI00350E3908